MLDSLEIDFMCMVFVEVMAILWQYDVDGLEEGEKVVDLLEIVEYY